MWMWVSEFPIYLFIFLLTEDHRSEPAPAVTLFCGKGPVSRVLSGHELTFLFFVLLLSRPVCCRPVCCRPVCCRLSLCHKKKRSRAKLPLGGSKAHTLDRLELLSFKTVVLSANTECKFDAFIAADDDVADSKLHGWFADWGRIQSQLQFGVFLYVERFWILGLTLESAALLPLSFFCHPLSPPKRLRINAIILWIPQDFGKK